MRYIIVDLEATCWEGGQPVEKMEIIEIGAVALESEKGPVGDEFAAFVRPVANRELSDFCRSLTTITQADVDGAEYFYDVFPRFLEWIGSEPVTLCSWGAYDRKQLEQDCARHKMPYPEALADHINLKAEFSRLFGIKPTGMRGALAKLGLPLEGQHHRGIDDARNIAQIALQVLPKLTEEDKA